MRYFLLCSLPLLLLFAGCRKEDAANPKSSTPGIDATDQNLPKIVAFGNSLTAGLGLPASQSYPAQLQKMLNANGYKYEVVNAGVSGDTTAGGLRRVEWSLEGDVKFLILELGGNDILRGQPISLLKQNLSEMIGKAQTRGVKVILAGMEAPSNSGPEYRKEVHQAYLDLAKQHDVVFIPFFLKDVAGSETLIQEDGTHPNAEGSILIAKMVYETLKPML